MRLTIDIPEPQQAISRACPVPLAAKGLRWNESCPGESAKEIGVDVSIMVEQSITSARQEARACHTECGCVCNFKGATRGGGDAAGFVMANDKCDPLLDPLLRQ